MNKLEKMRVKQTIINAIYAGLFVTMIAGVKLPDYETKAQEVQIITSSATPISKSTTVSHRTNFDNDVKQYVYEVFGDDYPKAFKLIECESKWNTKAINDNTTWGGIGQDRGLWQINNKFHPITDSCAYDYKCSTDYAYRMYKNDKYSFVRWTCGRK